MAESITPAVYTPGPNDPIPQDDRRKFQTTRVSTGNDILSSVLEPLLMGMRHSAGQVRSDISDIAGGNFNWDIASRLGELLGGLPLGKMTPAIQRGGELAKGIIAPTANKRLQELFAALRERAPKLVSQAEGAAQTVFPYLMPRESMPLADTLGVLRRSKTLPSAELYMRGGRPMPEQIDTLGHELRHFVTGTTPSLMNKPPAQALETAQQLSHMMPAPQQLGMQEYLTGVGTKSLSGRPMEVLKDLRGGAKSLQPGTAKDPAVAFDEALSYLTEALLGGNKGGDPALTSIASALGQGIK